MPMKLVLESPTDRVHTVEAFPQAWIKECRHFLGNPWKVFDRYNTWVRANDPKREEDYHLDYVRRVLDEGGEWKIEEKAGEEGSFYQRMAHRLLERDSISGRSFDLILVRPGQDPYEILTYQPHSRVRVFQEALSNYPDDQERVYNLLAEKLTAWPPIDIPAEALLECARKALDNGYTWRVRQRTEEE